jgi:hypothetical protein
MRAAVDECADGESEVDIYGDDDAAGLERELMRANSIALNQERFDLG